LIRPGISVVDARSVEDLVPAEAVADLLAVDLAMIRRIVLAAAAAAALILTPTVAMAQTAPSHTAVVALPQGVGFTCTVSTVTPAVVEPVKVLCSGGQKNQSGVSISVPCC
jgi:hypothetical protein